MEFIVQFHIHDRPDAQTRSRTSAGTSAGLRPLKRTTDRPGSRVNGIARIAMLFQDEITVPERPTGKPDWAPDVGPWLIDGFDDVPTQVDVIAPVDRDGLDSFDVDLFELDQLPSTSIRLDPAPVHPPPAPAPDDPPPIHLEVVVDTTSENNFLQDLDGELGVFVATYETLVTGTRVLLTVHMPAGSVELLCRVDLHRCADDDAWPGMVLRLDSMSFDAFQQVKRFTRWREPLFY